MFDARGANEHRVTMLALQHAMMRDPTEGDLRKCQLVLLGNSGDLVEGAEVLLVPVAFAVVASLAFLRVEARASLSAVVQRGVAASEEATANWKGYLSTEEHSRKNGYARGLNA